jgi:hypothetical protein
MYSFLSVQFFLPQVQFLRWIKILSQSQTLESTKIARRQNLIRNWLFAGAEITVICIGASV